VNCFYLAMFLCANVNMFQSGKMSADWFLVSLCALLANAAVVTPLMMFLGFRCEKREERLEDSRPLDHPPLCPLVPHTDAGDHAGDHADFVDVPSFLTCGDGTSIRSLAGVVNADSAAFQVH
jgi:hypothetical protein